MADPESDLQQYGHQISGSASPAPALDVLAVQSPVALVSLLLDESQSQEDDSRSTSSTSSPAANDNEESDFFLGNNDSQSSLGVPNLQDMQVYDDACLPPINRLPNEILISVFAKLNASADQLNCMLTCKRWARNTVDLLWHRPACNSFDRLKSICQTLAVERPYFAYRDFIKRLNLASLGERVSDGSVMALSACTRVERLTLANCKSLTDAGLIALVQNSGHLLALDISGDIEITEYSMFAISEHCKRLQGLNVSNCTKIANEGMVKLAESCRYLKRLKLNDCQQLTDQPIMSFAQNCPNIVEVDLQQCKLITNQPVTSLLAKGRVLRELRVPGCELIDDGAFLSLPGLQTYEHLRILDLTSCARLTDRAVEKIISVAPRLRNLVLAKCRNITDAAVYAISQLGKCLHYVHLGHCLHITDDAVKRLVTNCNRIRYIDLGCCANLTDESVVRLATLPKLKRIGLVKCASITDESVYALARANQARCRTRRGPDGNPVDVYYSHSSLERVHLSYCTNLTLKSIIKLLHACPRLTHLSLTGITAFLREDLHQFCRDAPQEFTQHQRDLFCVFSGQGVVELRRFLTTEDIFGLRNQDNNIRRPNRPNLPLPPQLVQDGSFDDQEPDAIDDFDGMDEASEMTIDAMPLLAANHTNVATGTGQADGIPPPPPPPPGNPDQPQQNAQYHGQDPSVMFEPTLHSMSLPNPTPDNWTVPPYNHGLALLSDAMEISPSALGSGLGPSTAPVGGFNGMGFSSSASGAILGADASGPSTASLQEPTPYPAPEHPASPMVQTADAGPSSDHDGP